MTPTRRSLLAGLGAGLAAGSSALAVRAQALPPAGGGAPRIGFMGFATPEADRPTLTALREGLREQGLADGAGVRVEPRHAGGDMTAAVAMIRELAALPVAAFVAPGPAAARSIRRVTDIPVVAIGLPVEPDPELFASIARPGGTVTGLSSFGEALSAKRIELLREVLPATTTIGILHNGTDPVFRDWGRQTEDAIDRAGLRTVRVAIAAATPEAIVGDVGVLAARGAGAVIVIRDFLTQSLVRDIVREASRRGLHLVAEQRIYVEAGALLSYGPDIPDLFRRAAGHVARILRGTPAADIPIEFPVRFELCVNLRTARDRGVSIPPAVLARADIVVE